MSTRRISSSRFSKARIVRPPTTGALAESEPRQSAPSFRVTSDWSVARGPIELVRPAPTWGIGAMSNQTWYSQLFENSFDGGVLLALPYDALGHWDGTGDDYED